MNTPKFLIESCLLTHGMAGISNEELNEAWPGNLNNIAWVDSGEIKIGGMDEFLPFRSRAGKLKRINCFTLQHFLDEKLSGALTAAGTMEACTRVGARVAVSCGIGGIGDVPGEGISADLPALETIPVTLIATSPKDMMDIRSTMAWLRDHDVKVIGADSVYCTGYLFESCRVRLDQSIHRMVPDFSIIQPQTLILNPIPEPDRLQDMNILRMADEFGRSAAAKGAYYHPAVNNEIDRLSGGQAAQIQLESIIDNAELAIELTE